MWYLKHFTTSLLFFFWLTLKFLIRNELEETLSRILDSLPEDKRCLFMSLSDCKVGEDEEKTELGIWRTNNFALGPTHSKCSNGVFATIARFNHSCLPSAEFVWNEGEGKQEVRAIRDIKVGEEISLCYFTSCIQLKHAEQRKQYLLEHYGFECNCLACSYTGKTCFKIRVIIRFGHFFHFKLVYGNWITLPFCCSF